MSDRAKLIELFNDSTLCQAETCSDCPYNEEEGACIAAHVDYLISNGVTMQKWIPVSERLPKDSEAQIEYTVRVLGWYCALEGDPEASETWEYVTTAMYDSDNKLWVMRGSTLNALMGIKDKPRCGDFITHWMPLPEPPQED